MSDPTQAVATNQTQGLSKQQDRAPVAIGPRGLVLNNLDDLWRFSQYVSKSGLAPKGIETPEAIFVACQLGLELGLPPMSALQNIAVINGRPAIFGDMALAICRAAPRFAGYAEAAGFWCSECQVQMQNGVCPSCNTKQTPEHRGVIAVARRTDQAEQVIAGFNIADAKRAGLWGKAGPWSQYPQRMLKWRARGFCLRDAFGDVLKGMRTVEEVGDIEAEEKAFRMMKPAFSGTPETITDTPAPAPVVVTSDNALQSQDHPGLTPSAPTRTTPEPEPETKKEPTSHEELGALMTANGITFDQFKAFAVARGIIEEAVADSLPDIDALDGRMLRRVLAKPNVLVQEIKSLTNPPPAGQLI